MNAWYLHLEFSSIWSTTSDKSTSGLGDRHLVLPTSAYVGHCSQWHHRNARPRKRGICIWNFVSSWSASWDISTSGLGGRHLVFQTSTYVVLLTSDIVHSGTVWMPDHENVVFAFEILLVSGLQHEIHELPVFAAAIFDFPIFSYVSRICKRRIQLTSCLLLCHK